jgi:hypothetical protein
MRKTSRIRTNKKQDNKDKDKAKIKTSSKQDNRIRKTIRIKRNQSHKANPASYRSNRLSNC